MIAHSTSSGAPHTVQPTLPQLTPRVDKHGVQALIPCVLFVRRLALLLLAALWLPATSHCRLEGAGLLFDSKCCETEKPIPVASDSHGCADDSCDVAEGDFTGPASASAKVSAPTAATALPLNRLLAGSVLLELPPGMGVSEATAAPPGLTEPTRLVLPGPLAPRAP